MTRSTLAGDGGRGVAMGQAHVVVAGIGVSGFAAADGLLQFGARVTVLDDSASSRQRREGHADRGAGRRPSASAPARPPTLPADADLVITTGWSPAAPLLVQAAARGVPIWSEVELAWRLSRPNKIIPWLGVTGTNGKTTTTQMLASMLAAAGLRTAAVGNIGRPIMEIVLDPEPYDVLAVELSSHQLHWSNSLALHSAAVLNLQPDHLEWHGSYQAYADAKAKIYAGVQASCVYNVADPATEQMVEQAEVVEGARAIGFTLGHPGAVDARDRRRPAGRPGVRRAAPDSALELATIADVSPAAPHNVANALAAAALARSYGVPATAVRDGLRNVTVGDHKIQTDRRPIGDPLGRRLQGHQPARGGRRPAGFRSRRLDRRWPGQGDHVRRFGHQPSGPAARRGAARRGSGDGRRSPGSTRARGPDDRSSRPPKWCHGAGRRGGCFPGHDRETRCCSPRGAPARTCTPTTPPGATPSPRPYASWQGVSTARDDREPR